MIILIELFLNSKLDLIRTAKFVKQLLRIQIPKGGNVLHWNQVKSKMEACYSELVLDVSTKDESHGSLQKLSNHLAHSIRSQKQFQYLQKKMQSTDNCLYEALSQAIKTILLSKKREKIHIFLVQILWKQRLSKNH